MEAESGRPAPSVWRARSDGGGLSGTSGQRPWSLPAGRRTG